MGAYLICPFALYEQKLRIGCEGCTITFDKMQSKNDYINSYCGSFEYRRCPHARELYLTKYKED